jgi:hypothetical protein
MYTHFELLERPTVLTDHHASLHGAILHHGDHRVGGSSPISDLQLYAWPQYVMG